MPKTGLFYNIQSSYVVTANRFSCQPFTDDMWSRRFCRRIPLCTNDRRLVTIDRSKRPIEVLYSVELKRLCTSTRVKYGKKKIAVINCYISSGEVDCIFFHIQWKETCQLSQALFHTLINQAVILMSSKLKAKTECDKSFWNRGRLDHPLQSGFQNGPVGIVKSLSWRSDPPPPIRGDDVDYMRGSYER